jgi:hypothetical protein
MDAATTTDAEIPTAAAETPEIMEITAAAATAMAAAENLPARFHHHRQERPEHLMMTVAVINN